MAHKVQSRAGVTIADVYDVKGSQAPIERLDVEEIKGVHELGATILSERFSQAIRRIAVEDIAQSTNFTGQISDLPAGLSRILGIQVFTDDATRLAHAAVNLGDAVREFPLFVWAGAGADVIRILENGSVANLSFLRPDPEYTATPSIMAGADQPQSMPNLTLRGTTTAFGAGTVDVTMLAILAFAAIGGISSRGLPVPSW